MRIFENLITQEQNDPLLFDNTLTIENIAIGKYNFELDDVDGMVLALNGTESTLFTILLGNTSGHIFTRYISLESGIQSIDFINFLNDFSGVRELEFTTNNFTEIQIGKWHNLSGGEVSSTGKRTTAKTFQTASGVVFQDISGYEYEEFNVQIPFLELNVYNEFKNIDLSVPHFVQWQGEFGRTDVVFCTISELTVQSIGLNAGYTMQINLREAK